MVTKAQRQRATAERYGEAILADARIKQILRKAVLTNKKFRDVLEYDPEGKPYFFIKFPEPNTSPEGEHILSEALYLPRCLKATL